MFGVWCYTFKNMFGIWKCYEIFPLVVSSTLFSNIGGKNVARVLYKKRWAPTTKLPDKL